MANCVAKSLSDRAIAAAERRAANCRDNRHGQGFHGRDDFRQMRRLSRASNSRISARATKLPLAPVRIALAMERSPASAEKV